MSKLYSSKKLLAFFLKEGFLKIGQKGSHLKLKYPNGRIVILPIHSKDVPYGTFRSIVEQSGLDLEYIISKL